jgi:hypothetical protein
LDIGILNFEIVSNFVLEVSGFSSFIIIEADAALLLKDKIIPDGSSE